MRFTLLRMFAVTALIALACAGMTYRTSVWTSIVVTLTMAQFTIVALRAIGQEKQDRAFSLGFAIVGGTYLLIATCSIFHRIYDSLLTNYPLAFAARVVASFDPFLIDETDPFSDLPPVRERSLESFVYGATESGSDATLKRFFLVGHCVWSWLFALVAGWFAARMYGRKERNQAKAGLA